MTLVTDFNKTVKNELSWIFQEYDTVEKQNEMIARRFLYFVSENMGYGAEEIEFKNYSKNPLNHFQLNMYFDNGHVLWGCFIHVNNKKVVAKRTTLELLNENFETIKVICKRK